jgi:hypothetical protein
MELSAICDARGGKFFPPLTLPPSPPFRSSSVSVEGGLSGMAGVGEKQEREEDEDEE